MSLSVLEKEEITESVRLTKRELQIIRSISLGYTSKEVAAQISKSKRVVDFHLTNIYDKLDIQGTNKRIQAINKLRKMKIIS